MSTMPAVAEPGSSQLKASVYSRYAKSEITLKEATKQVANISSVRAQSTRMRLGAILVSVLAAFLIPSWARRNDE